MTQQLTGKQVRFLRGMGHHLQPIVLIGKDEITDNLVESVQEALEIHELIKIKLQEGCIMDRKDVANALASRCDAAIAQILGRTILLFRPAKEAVIKLPKSNN
ncbi:MAG: ribosome assembly RNA-binding protein YhbY [Thermodesulfobacteriota bacterium]|nr:ribosome assembly RNA-binding protein YhbY [Thermodesulfobacteriota bacterium]